MAVELTEAAQQQALWGEVSAEWSALEAAAYARMPGVASRTVTVVSGKGGGNSTTTAAALVHFLSLVVPRLTVGVDLDPTIGKLRRRLAGQADPDVKALTEFVADAEQVVFPSELMSYLQVASGRVHLMHHDRARRAAVRAMRRPELDVSLARLSQLAQLVVTDLGKQLLDDCAQAGLHAADHLAIGALSTVDSLESTHQLLEELREDDLDDLVAGATVVLGVENPGVDLEELRPAIDWLAESCGGVFVVPYDPALHGGGLINWNELTRESNLGFLRACNHVAGCLARPARHTAGVPARPGRAA
ncbi:ParA family protein [Nakamurella endophytica]|uniref:MinD-like ATPase involved in chromosome partitioning or flagellar assembly n=1 Tax=Nakamurella endophytica TaxID=1748367 RepID=A0A917WMW4_9ACTN|nr:ParA family protein [Nakamurella endophytica]GGM15990.1 hypothetical protein GCM10011594_39990 [Nakamurella endophytica]